MTVDDKTHNAWTNRPRNEMNLGLEEWIARRVGVSTVAAEGGRIADINMQLTEAVGGRARHEAGHMNGLEKRYAAHLELRRVCGEIVGYEFEPLKLRLAKATFYSPDFLVMLPCGRMELHESKGFWEDDARVKIKVAAKQFGAFFDFVAAMWDKRNKIWKIEEFRA
jgi:hypothetical protein